MSKNLRIRTTPNGDDTYLKVKLEQDFDFIEVLSLKISQADAYRDFCSDYGVAVGRVIVNNGFGVPNAKISVFLPLTEEDLENAEIAKLYPYEVISDVDYEGIRYNLLPNESQGKDTCLTPIGTFPSKREVLDNDNLEEIYTKYYKFTTTTNDAGDFMFFGLPIGQHSLHVDADISDIGVASQKPYDLIRDGVSEKKFETTSKFKSGKQLNKLVQVRTQSPIGFNVKPFWGSEDNCDIGITRVDVDLNETIIPHAIFTGSLFGDSEKNAISKRCRPRRKTGDMEEVMTSAGRIEMIRKRPDDTVERFDVEGGEVIDEDGVWSYQIPMNLDNVITDEFGNLIKSNDPNKGLPTKAKVRFRIGMNEIGGLGRLRTRAKFLVPNNPTTHSDADYNFDGTTKEESFVELAYNKIYSIKSFIPRFNNNGALNSKTSISMKDVTKSSANINNFPFNKMDGDFNPLFSLLCFLFQLIVSILAFVFNTIVINVLNLVLLILNGVLGIICTIVAGVTAIVCKLKHLTSSTNNKQCRCDNCMNKTGCSGGDCLSACWRGILPYIPYIVFQCPNASGQCYAPYAFPRLVGKGATEKAYKECSVIQWPFEGECDLPDACYFACVTANLARALDVFEFLFYNDWINGSLYYTLFKYKVRSRETNSGTRGSGREKFCEYDCDSFQGYENYTGVDLNGDGTPDNKCRDRNYIVEGCLCYCSASIGIGCDDKTNPFSDGLIKKVGDEFYYAAITHDNDWPLFKTDVISLGSILECDWQGEPNIIKQLYDTTYHLPPLVRELDEDGTIEINGVEPLFTRINCAGINSRQYNCGNIRRYCELAVGDDEDRSQDGGAAPDGKLTKSDIESSHIRNVFAWLNEPGLRTKTFNEVNTDFTEYINENTFCNLSESEPDYMDFRFYSTESTRIHPFTGEAIPSFEKLNGIERIREIKNSFYFYFGLNAGKSALSKTVSRFFQPCNEEVEPAFIVICDIEDTSRVGLDDGNIRLRILGGDYVDTDYLFDWVVTPTTFPSGRVKTTQELLNIRSGFYSVEVTDPEGNVVKVQCVIAGPPPLNFVVDGSNITKKELSNGEILISNINGGIKPYTITWTGGGPFTIPAGSSLTSHPIENLSAGVYTITITDSLGETKSRNVTIVEPELLTSTVEITDQPKCTGGFGSFEIRPAGSFPPYDIWVTGPNGYTSRGFNNYGVEEGTYTYNISGSTYELNGDREVDGPHTVLIQADQISPVVTHISSRGVACKGGSGAFFIVHMNPFHEFGTRIHINGDRVRFKNSFGSFGSEPLEIRAPSYMDGGYVEPWNNRLYSPQNIIADEYRIEVTKGECTGVLVVDVREPDNAFGLNPSLQSAWDTRIVTDSSNGLCYNNPRYRFEAQPVGGYGDYDYSWWVRTINPTSSWFEFSSSRITVLGAENGNVLVNGGASGNGRDVQVGVHVFDKGPGGVRCPTTGQGPWQFVTLTDAPNFLLTGTSVTCPSGGGSVDGQLGSDKRLKTNLVLKGVSPNGINIYDFNYIAEPSQRYQGVIAQELIGTIHENAVATGEDGMYMVNYDLIDVEFKEV